MPPHPSVRLVALEALGLHGVAECRRRAGILTFGCTPLLEGLEQVGASGAHVRHAQAAFVDETAQRVALGAVGLRRLDDLPRLGQPLTPVEVSGDEPGEYRPGLAGELAAQSSSRSGPGMITSKGTSRSRRQMPSSVPLTRGLWLVSMTKVWDGSKDQKSSRIRRALSRSPPVSRLTVPSASRRPDRFVEHRQAQPEQVSHAGRVGVERPGPQQVGVGRVGVVAECIHGRVREGGLPVRAVP